MLTSAPVYEEAETCSGCDGKLGWVNVCGSPLNAWTSVDPGVGGLENGGIRYQQRQGVWVLDTLQPHSLQTPPLSDLPSQPGCRR